MGEGDDPSGAHHQVQFLFEKRTNSKIKLKLKTDNYCARLLKTTPAVVLMMSIVIQTSLGRPRKILAIPGQSALATIYGNDELCQLRRD